MLMKMTPREQKIVAFITILELRERGYKVVMSKKKRLKYNEKVEKSVVDVKIWAYLNTFGCY